MSRRRISFVAAMSAIFGAAIVLGCSFVVETSSGLTLFFGLSPLFAFIGCRLLRLSFRSSLFMAVFSGMGALISGFFATSSAFFSGDMLGFFISIPLRLGPIFITGPIFVFIFTFSCAWFGIRFINEEIGRNISDSRMDGFCTIGFILTIVMGINFTMTQRSGHRIEKKIDSTWDAAKSDDINLLAAQLKDRDSQTRCMAVSAINSIQGKDEQKALALGSALSDSDEQVRQTAASGLQKMQSRAAPAESALIQYLFSGKEKSKTFKSGITDDSPSIVRALEAIDSKTGHDAVDRYVLTHPAARMYLSPDRDKPHKDRVEIPWERPQ